MIPGARGRGEGATPARPSAISSRRPGEVLSSAKQMKVPIFPTSRSSAYPGTRRVLATRGGGTGRSGIRFASRAKFPRVRRFEIPVRAMCRGSSLAFRSNVTHPPDATARSIIPSRSSGNRPRRSEPPEGIRQGNEESQASGIPLPRPASFLCLIPHRKRRIPRLREGSDGAPFNPNHR